MIKKWSLLSLGSYTKMVYYYLILTIIKLYTYYRWKCNYRVKAFSAYITLIYVVNTLNYHRDINKRIPIVLLLPSLNIFLWWRLTFYLIWKWTKINPKANQIPKFCFDLLPRLSYSVTSVSIMKCIPCRDLFL